MGEESPSSMNGRSPNDDALSARGEERVFMFVGESVRSSAVFSIRRNIIVARGIGAKVNANGRDREARVT
jgi:hypothetical protein